MLLLQLSDRRGRADGLLCAGLLAIIRRVEFRYELLIIGSLRAMLEQGSIGIVGCYAALRAILETDRQGCRALLHAFAATARQHAVVRGASDQTRCRVDRFARCRLRGILAAAGQRH